MSYRFTRNAVPVPDVSEREAIIASATTLISQIPGWSKCKRVKHDKVPLTTTVSRTKIHDETWFARSTLIPESTLPFSAFREGLFRNHSKNESEYIHALDSATLVERRGEGVEVWRLRYKFAFPTGNRDFLVSLIAADQEGSQPAFLIIQINTESDKCPSSKEFIRATYTSIERVRQLDDGQVEWSMCTTTSPRGLVPLFIAEKVMPSQIAADVPSFIQWAQNKHRQGRTNN